MRERTSFGEPFFQGVARWRSDAPRQYRGLDFIFSIQLLHGTLGRASLPLSANSITNDPDQADVIE